MIRIKIKKKRDIIYLIIILLLCGYGIVKTWSHWSTLDALDVANAEKTFFESDAKIYRDKFNRQVYEAKEIATSYKNLQKIHIKDTTELGKDVRRLQSIVSRNTRGATIIKTESNANVSGKIDTVFRNGSCDTMPVYHFERYNAWYFAEGYIGKNDSFDLNIGFNNDMEITHEWKTKNIFDRGHPEIKVVQNNPYTITKKTVSYQATETPKQKKKRKTINRMGDILKVVAGFIIGRAL